MREKASPILEGAEVHAWGGGRTEDRAGRVDAVEVVRARDGLRIIAPMAC